MLRVTGLSKGFGAQRLLSDADWFVGRHDRVALIGPNGCGKSTLLRIIAGLEGADGGTIDLPRGLLVGHLAQSGFTIGNGTVRDEARAAFQEVLQLQDELLRIEERLAQTSADVPDLKDLTVRQGDLLARLAILGAHEVDRRVHQVLTGLGFRESDFDRSLTQLSGGWQMRAALGRILLQRPELLLLDEPTNHLDLEAREWLEGYLQEYPYAVVLVSHDRYFLDVTVQRVSEITGYRIENYAGNYSFYEQEREKRHALRLKAYTEQQAEIARVERFIQRFRSDKRRAAQVQARIRMLAKLVRLEAPVQARRAITLRYPESATAGRVVLELRAADKSYGTQTVFSGINLRILRGSRVALVGPNGAGKSTLMRILAGSESPDAGERRLGHQVALAFFAQDEGSRFDSQATVLETVSSAAPIDFVPQVRGLLGAFLFSGDAVEKRVGTLSGGELNRLAIASLLVRPANLLLLDEPTNHLDLASKDALLESLHSYPGTIVFVSHDRHFLDALATHVIEVGGARVSEYPGSYADYLWQRQRKTGQAVAGATPAPPAQPATAAVPREVAPSATPPSTARRSRPARRLPEELEREIGDLEQQRARFAAALGLAAVYTDRQKSDFYLREIETIGVRLEGLYREWERLLGGSEGPA